MKGGKPLYYTRRYCRAWINLATISQNTHTHTHRKGKIGIEDKCSVQDREYA
jgi:hypothetical protein